MNRFVFLVLLATFLIAFPALAAAQETDSVATPSASAESQVAAELDGEAALIDRAELDELSSSQPDLPVTVLISLERADAVSSSTSVERTFDRDSGLSFQSVGSSNAIFVSGPANLVFEATRRLEALDAATPEKRVLRRQPSQPEEIGGGVNMDEAANGIGFLIVGVIGLIFATLIALRRWGA